MGQVSGVRVFLTQRYMRKICEPSSDTTILKTAVQVLELLCPLMKSSNCQTTQYARGKVEAAWNTKALMHFGRVMISKLCPNCLRFKIHLTYSPSGRNLT